MGKGPYLPDLQTLVGMGINPQTGLPYKWGGNKATLKEDLKKCLRVMDKQDAVNRYVWYNLPMDITSQELEKWLYERGQLCFFYDDKLKQFFFASYALEGTLDCYGRFNHIKPLPLTGGTDPDGKRKADPIEAYWATKKLKCVYGMKLPEELKIEDLDNSSVILRDYSRGLNNQVIPRINLNDPILDVEAEIIPMCRTNMIASCGVKGVRVPDEDSAHNVKDGSKGLINASLTGDPWVPVIGDIEFQELTDGQTGKNQDYFLALQSLENFRLSLYGIDNGGLFEKKAHELQSEADLNGGPIGLVMQDGLSIRQNFCNIVNSIWGLGIWCEPAENIMGADMNGDGLMYDRNEGGENSGVETGGESDE